MTDARRAETTVRSRGNLITIMDGKVYGAARGLALTL